MSRFVRYALCACLCVGALSVVVSSGRAWVKEVLIHGRFEASDAELAWQDKLPLIEEEKFDALLTWKMVQAYKKEHREADALPLLDKLILHLPRIADRLHLHKAELFLKLSRPLEARLAYDVAAQSLDSTVRVLAETGVVRALIAANDRKAENALHSLVRRYPELPNQAILRWEFANKVETAGSKKKAVSLYAKLIQEFENTSYAGLARERIDALMEQGTPIDGASRSLVEKSRVKKTLQPVVTKVAAVAAIEPAPTLLTPSVKKKILSLLGGRLPVRKTTTKKMLEALNLAVEAKWVEGMQALVDYAFSNAKLLPINRLQVAVAGFHHAEADSVRRLLEVLMIDERVSIPARYFLARYRENHGDWQGARELYESVVREEKDPLRYYSLWAEQRLRQPQYKQKPPIVWVNPPPKTASAWIDLSNLEKKKNEQQSLADYQKLVSDFETIAENYGEHYPWLLRAKDLIQLEEWQAAADELYEAYAAWRHANGKKPLRAGLMALVRKKELSLPKANRPLRQARLLLSAADREIVARMASVVGDEGTAILFRAGLTLAPWPRAYGNVLQKVAREYQVDPNLLLAVMKVESVYQKRIISYAGAVGLMQIMPGTGRRIAQQLQVEDFYTAQLLEPETNLRFSAWYLRSLLRRFGNSLPLALAAYNGGPHNVRQWINRFGPDTALDVFLEQIPFGQTHRYVRRVLNAYAQYLKEEGRSLPDFALELRASYAQNVNF